MVEHAPINLLAFASVGSSLLGGCHFVSLGKTLNSHCLQWAKEFHQCILTDICGLLPELLFSVGLLRALRFPPTAIRQMDNGQRTLNMERMKRLRVRRVMEIKPYKSRITITILLITGTSTL